jgi:hypothetical protein
MASSPVIRHKWGKLPQASAPTGNTCRFIWDHSHRSEVPDPLEAEKPEDDELPHDPEFSHE